MTREEIRGLIGAYASGSLTEEERGVLFNAALEDQEIFDELAREQALKDAIEQPGARERLLRSLAPKPWWRPMWVWATAGAAVVALICGIILIRSGAPPQQIARVEVPAPPAPPQQQATPKVAVNPEPHAQQRLPPKVAQGPAGTAAQREPAPAQPRAAAAAPPPASIGSMIGGIPAGVGGARGGGGGGGAGPRALAAPMAARAPVPPGFSFDYSVTPDGLLRITAGANGFLSVSSDNGTSVSDVLSSRQVQAGSMTELRLPANTVTAIILFSARERTYLAGDFAASQDPLSGTKSDPNPSTDSVLMAHVRLKP